MIGKKKLNKNTLQIYFLARANHVKMSMQTSRLPESLIPLDQILRPIQPVLDQEKIEAMVSTMRGVAMPSSTISMADATARANNPDVSSRLPPIDVMAVRDSDTKTTIYYAFGGCHRLQAYDRLARESSAPVLVNCRLMPMTKHQLKLYTGVAL